MRLNQHQNTTTDYKRAGDLRSNASPVEKKLWVVLREEAKLRNLKFRRQHAVHPYIVDFACLEVRLLIELDGSSHEARQAYDQKREQDLRQMGFNVVRFSNDEVTKNVTGVVVAIMEKVESLRLSGGVRAKRNAPLPNPPREGEGIEL